MAEDNGAPTRPRRRPRAVAADATTMQPAEALAAAAPSPAVDEGAVAPAEARAVAAAPTEPMADVPSAAAGEGTSAPAEALAGAVAAGAVAMTISEPVETLEFEFAADRFGNNPDTEGMEGIYASDAVRALEHWRGTLKQLFGDPDSAL